MPIGPLSVAPLCAPTLPAIRCAGRHAACATPVRIRAHVGLPRKTNTTQEKRLESTPQEPQSSP